MNEQKEKNITFKFVIQIFLIGVFTALLSLIIANKIVDFKNFILILIAITLVFKIMHYPEILFALFLTAGTYKADPRLEFIQNHLDLTITLGVLTVISFLIQMNNIRKITIDKQLLKPYLVFILISAISLLYTPAPIYGVDKFLRFITITTLALFFPFLLTWDYKKLNRFFITIVLLALTMFVDMMGGGITKGTIGFRTALGSNYLAAGRIIGTATIIALFFILTLEKAVSKIIYFMLIPFLSLGVFIPGGRGPILALFISILFILILNVILCIERLACARFLPKSSLYLNIFGIFFVLILIIVIGIFPDYFVTTFKRFEILLTVLGESATGRISMYKAAVKAITNYPTFIIGLGIGGFSKYFSGIDTRLYPHNIFLEIFSELGIFGVTIFVIILIRSILIAVKQFKTSLTVESRVLYITLFGLFIFMLINSSISGDINDNRLLFTWIGFIFAFNNNT